MSNILDEFEQTIGPDTAIKWYTGEHIIYRLFNTACYTHNFEFLIKLQYLIRCIHIQLQREHSLFIRHWSHKPVFSIYCGRLMTTIEFKRFKMYVGKIVFMTNFIMGNLNKTKAIQYINRCEPSENETRVLFKINIDTRVTKTQPYADITHLSNDDNEHEVLIMFGASFHVMDIIMNPHDTLPIYVLELCADKLEPVPPNEREQRWYEYVESLN
ncbi:unnamed protein product [Rotaria sp. Silwood2]|nr:unnamed protein product [Rotaria sp. Silwood2]CAF3880977.1 unnamed protein product [Rotaria sp. Silwood2]